MKFSFRFFWLFLLPCLLFVLCSPLTYASESSDLPKTPLEYSLFEIENGIDSKDASISLYLGSLRNQDVVFDFGGVTYTHTIRYYFRYYDDWQISGLTPSSWFNANGVNEWNGTETIEFSIDNYNGLFDYPINKGGVFDIQFNVATEGLNFAYAYEPYIILRNKEHTKQQVVTDVNLLQTTNGYFRFVFEDITADFDIYYFDVRIFAFPNVSSIDDYSRIEATTDSGHFCYITELEPDALLNKLLQNSNESNNKLGNIITQITELPNKIWTVFSDGLKSLFIPSEDDITAQQDKWNQLLEDRFGALYQTIDMIHQYAETFVQPETQGQVEFPGITVDLAGSDFVFGGQMVDVVPDGFEFLIDVVKTIISILATILFVNGLKNRFERLVGGSDDI